MTGNGNHIGGEVRKLLERYYPRLVAYARHFTRDDAVAEDLVQDAFYNFLRKYSSCSPEEFPPIIFRIVRNCCLNWIKHNYVVDNVVVKGPVSGEMLYNLDFLSQEADGNYLYEELIRQVDDILDKLPERCREVFEMSRFRMMSNEDIADTLGISIKTVKNHMTRALAEFRHYLGKETFVIFLFLFVNF